MDTNEVIKYLRKKEKLTQSELAEKMNISRPVLHRIEAGTRPIRENELLKFAKFFNVSLDTLLGYKQIQTDSINSKDLQDLSKFLNNTEVLFDGEEYKLDEEDKQKIRNALEFAFWEVKKRNKRK